jgi:hypothetical protein
MRKSDASSDLRCTEVGQLELSDQRIKTYLSAEGPPKAGSSHIKCDVKGKLAATPSFEGRHDILRQMHERFDHAKTSHSVGQQRRFVLHGLGGTGKTETVRKFIEQARDQ